MNTALQGWGWDGGAEGRPSEAGPVLAVCPGWVRDTQRHGRACAIRQCCCLMDGLEYLQHFQVLGVKKWLPSPLLEWESDYFGQKTIKAQ